MAVPSLTLDEGVGLWANADRDAATLGAGLEYKASQRLSVFSRYEEVVGAKDVSRYVTLGGRFVW